MSKKRRRGGCPQNASHRKHRISGYSRKPKAVLLAAQRELEKLKVKRKATKFFQSSRHVVSAFGY